jgi:hypothetical protein
MNTFPPPAMYTLPMFVSSLTSPPPMLKLITFLFFFLSFFKTIAQYFNEKEVEFWDLSQSFKPSGTLTTPKSGKNYPLGVLISGSAQADGDETIGKLKISRRLAEYIGSNGLHALRYDYRRGFKSEELCTALGTSLDLVQDIAAAVTFFQKSEKVKHTRLIGWSEGGGKATVVASKMKKIKFLAA